MKKLLLLSAFLLGGALAAVAQPSLFISSETPCDDGNESFCSQVTVADFTSISRLRFWLRWDPSVIQYEQVTGFGLTNMTGADFDESMVNEGLLLVEWQYAEIVCEPGNDGSEQKEDGQVIFEVCFESISTYGASTTLEVVPETDPELDFDPFPHVIVDRPSGGTCQNIGLAEELMQPAVISTCVDAIFFTATDEQGNPGDLVCVDVLASGFNALVSVEYSLFYDTSLLEFVNVLPNEEIPELSLANFGLPNNGAVPEGRVFFSWASFENTETGVSILDSTLLYQLCFRVVGECGRRGSISFSENVEVTNAEVEELNLPVVLNGSEVFSGPCDPPGLKIAANCGPEVNLNDEVCVQVVAPEGMVNISDLEFLMEWNPRILQFKEFRSVEGPALLNGSINTDNTVNGILGLEYNAPGTGLFINLDPGETVFEVCFDVIGLGGNSFFRFDPSTALVRENNGPNMGLAPANCEVMVFQPDGIQIFFNNDQAPPSDTACVGVNVSNFNGITRMDFSLIWETVNFQFVEISNLNLDGLSQGDFNLGAVDGGLLTVNFTPASPLTVPDGTTIFDVCYEVVGEAPSELVPPQEFNCDSISVSNFPAPVINSETTGTNNLPLTSTNGEICIQNPDGFFLIPEKDSAFIGLETCVDFKVGDFNDITSAQFTVNWNPSNIKFTSVSGNEDLGLTVGAGMGNLDTASASVGILRFDWSDPGNMGQMLPDSAILFSICYEGLGPVNTCTPISINNEPNPSVTLGDGSTGSVFFREGEVCIKDRFIITDTIISAVSCPDARDGTIELRVEGGTGQVFFNWASSPLQTQPKAIRLPVGRVPVVIFDSAVPPLIQRDTFDIPLTEDLPLADAGPDQALDCNLPFLRVNGEASQGPEYSYRWTTSDGQISGSTTEDFVLAAASGTYVFAVTNDNTGCTIRDTVELLPPDLPTAVAGPDQDFDCATESLMLAGSGSSVGDTIQYSWLGLNGGFLDPGQDTLINPVITSPGTYILEVAYSTTGCSSTDTVEINDVRDIPLTDAGPDRELGCNGSSVTLDGRRSQDPDRDLVFTWRDATGMVIGNADTVAVSDLGLYTLEVEDSFGCAGLDTALVLPSNDFPEVNAGPDTSITCAQPTVQLNATVNNATDFIVQWSSPDGGMLAPDTVLNPVVTAAGTFILTVTNNETSCVASDSVVVNDLIEEINVDAGAGGAITCDQTSVLLNASGLPPSDTLEYTWRLGQDVIAVDTLQVEAFSPGLYTLEVFNTINSCTASDTVRVADESQLPEINTVGVPVLGCSDEQTIIEITISPQGAPYIIQWSVPDGSTGNIVTGGNTTMPTVDAVGVYEVGVTNTATNCLNTAQVTVQADTLAPTADAGPDQLLSCLVDTVTLDGRGSSSGQNFIYQWSAVGGGSTPFPVDAPQAQVEQPGNYFLLVTDTINGCTAGDTVSVLIDTIPPSVFIAEPDLLTCTSSLVTLDGSASNTGAEVSVTWTGLQGQQVVPTGDRFIVEVSAPGPYELRIRDLGTGCENAAVVEVLTDDSVPTAIAATPAILSCPGTTTTLDGSGSSVGADISYNWTVLSGSGLIQNPTSLNPQVDQVGVYQLEVTNATNGCSSVAAVEVVLDPTLPIASAGSDQFTCESSAQLEAVAPADGFTGLWTSLSGAIVETPDFSITQVTGLISGANRFVWTLSSSTCANFSADTVAVTRETAPIANNDNTTVSTGQNSIQINVIANDQLNTNGGFNLTITRQPGLGTIDTVLNGTVSYRIADGLFGEDNFTYQICNNNCPTLCDTALVNIAIPVDPDFEPDPEVNAITPNGDGVNDRLTFNVLEDFPSFQEGNELIIFNRWGDIVFEAAPYQNGTWEGTTDGGQMLPEGTYYYVLRLDIPNGKIERGNITILR